MAIILYWYSEHSFPREVCEVTLQQSPAYTPLNEIDTAVLSCIVSAIVFLSVVMGLHWLLTQRRNITRNLYLIKALKNC